MLRNKIFMLLTSTFFPSIALNPLISIAKQPNMSPLCIAAIKNGENRLRKIDGLTVVPKNIWRDVRKDYSGWMPEKRIWSYTFVFEGKVGSIDSVFSSPVLMNAISTHVIQNCSSVSLVLFNRYASGRYVAYGLMPSKGVKQFDCVPNGCYGPYAPKFLQWGMNCC